MKKTIKYRVFIEYKGHLERPTTSRWNGLVPIYPDFDSQQEAIEALENAEDWTDHIILPVAISHV